MRFIPNVFLTLVIVLAIGHVMLSWVPRWRARPLGMVIYRVSEPPLRALRSLLRSLHIGGSAGLDLSPIVFFLLGGLIYLGLRQLLPR